MKSDNHIHDLIIIGGGPGGLTAGIYAMRAALDVILLEKGAPGGQVNSTDEVENWPGTINIGGADLAMAFAAHAKSYGLPITNREVIAIEPGDDFHTVRLDNDEELRTLAIILGTGGNPKKLGIVGEQEYYGKGVSYCAVCDGFFFRGKNVAVVGGGDSAAEEALYLAKICKKVYMIHRRDALRAGMILQQRIKAEPKIEMVWNSVPTAIISDDTVVPKLSLQTVQPGVTDISLKNNQTGSESRLTIDGVFIFVGFEPDGRLVPAGTKLSPGGYVITDEKCETSMSGIFAIGDLREKYARQIVTAAADGCTAALAAAHYVENKKATR